MSNVLYRKQHSATCDCGWWYPYWTTMNRLNRHIEYHEEHCNGTITVDEL